MTIQSDKKRSYDRAKAILYARMYWNKVCSDGAIGTKSRLYRKVDAGTKFRLVETPVKGFPGQRVWTEEAPRNGEAPIPQEDLEDCTHFVSCCLGRVSPATAGGGLDLPWLYGGGHIYGYLNPEALIKGIALSGRPFAKIVKSEGISKLTYKQAAAIIDTSIRQEGEASSTGVFEPGDVIVYSKPSSSIPHHATLYLGQGKIACHTMCRVDDKGEGWKDWQATSGLENNWHLGASDEPRDDLRYTLLHITA